MAHSQFNVTTISDNPALESGGIEMNVEEVKSNGADADNPNWLRSTVAVDVLLNRAAENGGKIFKIFLSSMVSNSIPKRDPRLTQRELKAKVAQAAKIDDMRYTRSGDWILSTNDLQCAVELSQITEFQGVAVKTRIIWENLTNRFLIFNVPTDIPLAEIADELSVANGVHILELRRFIRREQQVSSSPVLITLLGTNLPSRIKLWYTVQSVRQFIDKPRQCAKCHKYNHTSAKCQSAQICVTCGFSHESVCTTPVSCVNCKGDHRADFNQCPYRLKEIEFLQFKCSKCLSFVEARRQFFTKKGANPSYAQATATQTTDLDALQKFLEARTNAMLKILHDAVLKQTEKVNESVTALSNVIMKSLEQLSESLGNISVNDTPRKKRPGQSCEPRLQQGSVGRPPPLLRYQGLFSLIGSSLLGWRILVSPFRNPIIDLR